MESLYSSIPRKSVVVVKDWVKDSNFLFKSSNPRSTKLGDFKFDLRNNRLPIITVNKNLNQYQFLITFTHEYAHYLVWKKYNAKVRPHGKEWKSIFKALIVQLISNQIFPSDIVQVLAKHIINPKASTSGDLNLVKVLRRYDANKKDILNDLPANALFKFNNRIFVKGSLRRTRYLCEEIATKKKYLISGVAEVDFVEK